MTTEENENQEAEGQDNSLIRSLRAQVDSLQKELKNRPDPTDIDSVVTERIQRRDSARDALSTLGFPPQMTDLVTANVEGDITEDAVKTYLTGLGFQPGQQENQANEERAREVANVASLGSQVASATRKEPGSDSIEARLSKATSQAEIDALMREAGLSAS